MIIKIQEDIVTLDEAQNEEQVLEAIESLLKKHSAELGFLVINGEITYEDYRETIRQKNEWIREIEVVPYGSNEWLEDLFQSGSVYVEAANAELATLGASFQLNEEDIPWDQFQRLLEGVSWLSTVISMLIPFAQGQVSETLQENDSQLKLLTKRLLDSLEDKDRVLTGDLIQYEFAELYEALQRNFQLFQSGVEAR